MALTFISACARCGKRIQTRVGQQQAPVCHPCRRLLPEPYVGRRPAQPDVPKAPKPAQPCATCGGPTTPGKTYCSAACSSLRDGRPRRAGRHCEVCGKQYDATYREQRTCGRACGLTLKYGNRPPLPECDRWPSSRIYTGNCAWCDQPFVRRRSRPTYCSKSCGDQAYNQRVRPPRHRRGEWRCESCEAPVADHQRKCDDCRAAVRRDARRRRRQAERVRKLGLAHEPYTLAVIASRDRYRCGLCGKRVAMTKQVPHPKAPTIDHVMPIACGGDDTRANVQLAHFLCNSVKGPRGGGEQLALVG